MLVLQNKHDKTTACCSESMVKCFDSEWYFSEIHVGLAAKFDDVMYIITITL